MKILILNQAFFPDVVSASQHASDLARALAAEGHQVTVVCSRRGYDSPSVTFPSVETWEGVTIRRIWCTGFGKTAKWRRALDFASFLASCLGRLCTLGRFDCVLALTAPPLISFVGLLFARITGARLVLWLMDINPDEAVAAGWLREGSFPERVLAWCLYMSLRGAARIVVLDRFMRERIVGKGIPANRVSVIAPWIHSDAVHLDVEGRRQFRERHGLSAKFVVMYSGNHSPCHPLGSLAISSAYRISRSKISRRLFRPPISTWWSWATRSWE
jgi:colanic acid biosynthesis glycosyl transferase WcaI